MSNKTTITSVNIPDDLLKYINSLIEKGFVRNRKEVIVSALRNYRRLSMHEWKDPLIFIRGVRKGLVTRVSINEFARGLPDGVLRDAGRRMGQTLRDVCLATSGADIRKRANWPIAFSHLRDMGWGSFEIKHDSIVVTDCFLPKSLMVSYLAYALGVELSAVPTVEEVLILREARNSKNVIRKPVDA